MIVHSDEATLVYRLSESRLEGDVRVSGAKNSALRLLAASLLTAETIEILNYPSRLRDAEIHVAMLERLGKSCTVGADWIRIEEVVDPSTRLTWEGRSIRNTLLILGALTARHGRGSVPLPGGCRLGDRKYDLHVQVLEQLGARVWEEETYLCAEGQLRGADIHLPLRSTGATENALLCASLAEGETRIWNPHVRPEILNLCDLIRLMGAEVHVHGQEHIHVVGTTRLGGAKVRTLPDNMEALTWLVGSVMTRGDVEIHDFPFDDLEVPLIHLRESGARLYRGDNSVVVRGGRCLPIEISTGPYPGINSDMQPLFAAWGTMAHGQSRIIDLRFPGRYAYASQFAAMGAKMKIEGNLLYIDGGDSLVGASVRAPDLRAGVALALAAMTARGTTTIADAWQIERGYDSFIGKLRSLGGSVEVVGHDK